MSKLHSFQSFMACTLVRRAILGLKGPVVSSPAILQTSICLTEVIKYKWTIGTDLSVRYMKHEV